MKEFDGVGKIFMGFVNSRLDFCFVLAFATIEKTIDVLLGHQIMLFWVFGRMRSIDGFVEFGTAIFPKLIAVDGPEDVRDVSGEGSHLFLFPLSA